MNKIKNLLLMALISLTFFASSSLAVTCLPGTGYTEQSGVCIPVDTGLADPVGGISTILVTVLNWILGLVAVITVLMIVIAGVMYITSAGNENQAETAKRNLTSALIGLAIALSALVLVNTIAFLMQGDGFYNFEW